MKWKIYNRLYGLMAEDEGAAAGGGQQTIHDQTGQEAAEGPSSANEQEEDWGSYTLPEDEEPDYEAQEATESGTGEEESPATPSSEEQEAPAEQEGSEQEQQEEGTEAASEESEEASTSEEEESQQQFSWEQYQEQRKNVQEQLKESYRLTDEQADKLLENPDEVLPDMAAQIYVDVFEGVMQTMQAQFPQMMEMYEQQRQNAKKSEDEFYSQFPKLRGHEDTVDRIAQAYRQVNPNVSREKFIKEVGAQAHWALGVPVKDEAQAQGQQESPHKPAAPGNRGQAPADRSASEPANEFEAMHEEDFE